MKDVNILPLKSISTCAFAPHTILNYMYPYYEFDLYIKDWLFCEDL